MAAEAIGGQLSVHISGWFVPEAQLGWDLWDVAMAVNEQCMREVIGAEESMKEDKESWLSFLRHLKERGLKGTQLFSGDKCLGLMEALGEVYPQARFQRCMVHFYRNVFSVVPQGK